jgi:hypothetical protein
MRPARLTQRGGWNPRAGAAQLAPQAEKRPYLAPPPAPLPPTPLEEAQRTAGDLKSFFASLAAADRLAAGASIALLVSLALPWRWTRADDEIIGLVAAWPLFLLAGGIIALVYLRARRADAALDRKLRLAQGGAALLCAALGALFLPYATESRAVRAAAGLMVSLPQSRPELGAYLGLVCAVGVLVGSLPAALGERR